VERYLGSLERLLLPVLAALLAFITIGVFIQVVLRYVFATSFLWGEELSLFAFIWCVFLGSCVCSWRRTHFAFDLFEDRLKGRVAAAQRLLVNLSVLTVTVVMVITGWQFSQLSVQRLSPALGITLLVPTIVMPLAGVLMSLSTLADIARDLRRLWFGGERPASNPS
jgi:TRAP-type C4-dicarboxylate transport system permease small subunit